MTAGGVVVPCTVTWLPTDHVTAHSCTVDWAGHDGRHVCACGDSIGGRRPSPAPGLDIVATPDISAEHVLRVVAFVRTNRVVRQLECPDCDLRITFTIRPPERGEDFARVLQAAHTQQIEEAHHA